MLRSFTFILIVAFISALQNVEAQAQTTCGPIYVTSTATPAGSGTRTDPANLLTGISMLNATDNILWLAAGSYTITEFISIPNDVTIEGGFDPVTWVKSNGTPTIINRTNANALPPPANALVGFAGLNASGFRLQDLTINVADAGSAGISVYGIYLAVSSNYNIVRCEITTGAGGNGLPGSPGIPGTPGSPGSPGLPAGYENAPPPGGAGGVGVNNGGNGGISARWNGSSAGGQAGSGPGGCGGAGGNSGSGANCGCGLFGSSNNNDCEGNNPVAGQPGSTGLAGSAGSIGTAGAFAGGYYTLGGPGGNGTAGGDGCGGGGGGGGGAAVAGGGGFGASVSDADRAFAYASARRSIARRAVCSSAPMFAAIASGISISSSSSVRMWSRIATSKADSNCRTMATSAVSPLRPRARSTLAVVRSNSLTNAGSVAATKKSGSCSPRTIAEVTPSPSLSARRTNWRRLYGPSS